jgi:hypothetical protein
MGNVEGCRPLGIVPADLFRRVPLVEIRLCQYQTYAIRLTLGPGIKEPGQRFYSGAPPN